MAGRTTRTGNLPAEATRFIGRRRQLAELRKKLTAGRLVSLVGPGGVGKSRLAVRGATDLGRSFKDGAWLVELAEVRDPALVSNAVMAALDLRDQAATEPLELVLSYLKDKSLLLVVDNCEHLLGAAAHLVSEVLRAAPDVRVISTTREPLSVSGEHVIPVPPLELPSAHAAEPLKQLRLNEAVMLFVERAEAASGSFELTAANQSAVADLCRRLDGLPLAIELAAVRTRVLTVEQILDRLSDRFGLLTGGGRAALPRQQTLQTAIDWSHELLTRAEQTLLRRQCVFAGRFTLEDVESVCSEDGAPAGVLDLLSSLVDKSLVMKEDAKGRACYRLHETMREYAANKVREAGEEEDLHDRYTEYYVSRCRRTALQARFGLLEWLAWMDVEIDNIRSVLRQCLDQSDSVKGLDLATSLSWYWITRATTEGVRWLDDLLACGPTNSETIAWAYFIRGFLAVLQGDWPGARPRLELAIAAARDAGKPIPLAHSLTMASIADTMAGDRTSAGRFLDEAQAVAAVADDVATTVGILQARALKGAIEGDFETVKLVATEGARLSREAGDLYALQLMLLNLGGAALAGGDPNESKRRYEEALRIAYKIDDRIGQFYPLTAPPLNTTMSCQHPGAAHLMGASESIRIGAGATVMAVFTPLMAQAEESASAALGASKYAAEFEIGRGLSRDDAVRLALGKSHAVAAASEHASTGVLGKRGAGC